jgi:hypothetical protein
MCILGGAVEPFVVRVWTAKGTWLVTRPSARNGANSLACSRLDVNGAFLVISADAFRGGGPLAIDGEI